MGDRRKRILVIDDSTSYLDFMRTLLTTEGYEVETAATLAASEHSLAAARPDLVIADALMPGLPPFAVVDLLRARDDTRDIPVLICTAAVREVRTDANRLKQDGAEVLLKPFDIDVLLDRVSRICDASV